MCVAYPGRVVSISGTHGMVDFSGTVVPVNLAMVPVKIGDYVLVHAGMAIQMIQAGSCMAGVSCSLQWMLMTDSMPA
jgi:hydrogenase expression/formation protein HypC